MFISNKEPFNSLGQLWIQCMRDILSHGNANHDENDVILELTNYYAEILSVDETDHILTTYANQKRIAHMKKKYSSCDVLPDYKISYGKLLYDNNGINQIEWIVNRLKMKIESKSATISMHIAGDSELSCLSLLDFKCRDEYLNMNVVYRSQNVFSSQPGNLISLRQIQSYVAKELNKKVGSIELIVFSAHIYENDLDMAEKIVKQYDTYCDGEII
ncbi:thymidylate synthase [Wukongibacter baidiensis]|uniref:thymidylate synthase n=1 Tax=Wukongibacter baidiensis TaxID=1723361 RepID=UPI003D7F8710